jgi:hypothetical protein
VRGTLGTCDDECRRLKVRHKPHAPGVRKALAAALIAGAPASNTRNRVRDARIGSGREQHVRDPIELDLDCGLLIFEDGEWRLRKSWLHAATAAAAAAASSLVLTAPRVAACSAQTAEMRALRGAKGA